MSADAFDDIDWYKVLGCSFGSSKEEVEKAARKLSAKYHPDKNHDPAAAPIFLQIQKAKDFLLDEEKRKVYDDKLRAAMKRKEYDAQRNQNMDSKRKKLKEEFENRMKEESKRGQTKTTIDLDQLRRANMEKREHASKAMNERDRKTAEFMEQRKTLSKEIGQCQVKIKWKRSRQSHSDESLYQLFKVFGSIEEVTFVGDEGNKAVLTFTSEDSARQAVDHYATAEDMRVTLITNEKKMSSVFSHIYEKPAVLNESKINADELFSRLKTRHSFETSSHVDVDDESQKGGKLDERILLDFFELENKVLNKLLSSLSVEKRNSILSPLRAVQSLDLDQR